MSSFSIWHWVIILVYLAVLLIPATKILQRTGYSAAWALVLLIPVVNLIAYWVFAFKEWPINRKQTP